jgi:hypothetical protein
MELEEHAVSIFKTENSLSKKHTPSRGMFAACLILVSTLKMEAIFSSKTLLDFNWSTWHNI